MSTIYRSLTHTSADRVLDSATYDLDKNVRVGTRSVSVGERPFYDPKSVSRREGLYNEKAELEKANEAVGDGL